MQDFIAGHIIIGHPDFQIKDENRPKGIVGNDKMQAVIETLIGKSLRIPYIMASGNETVYRDSDTAGSLPGFENNALLSLLVRLQQHIGTANYALNEVRTAFEHCLNDTAGMVGWLHNGSFSVAQKRAIFLSYMADSPDKAIRLIRETIASDESAAALWSEIIGKDDAQRLIKIARTTTATSTASDTEDGGMKLLPSDDWKTGQNGRIFGGWAAWLLSPSVSDTGRNPKCCGTMPVGSRNCFGSS